MPEVSVCVVNWNCRDLLRACLRSLDAHLQQTDLEIIVIDNASSDGAPDLVASEFPHVTLVRNAENIGFGRANNQAARLARGRRLFFLNNDTEVSPGGLRHLLDYADAHPEIAAIGPRLVGSDGEPQVSFRGKPTVCALLHRTVLLRWTGLFRSAYRRYRGRTDDFETTRPAEALLGAALLMDRERFHAAGGWDEGFVFGGEDLDLCDRLSQLGPVIYYPRVTLLHHGRASSRLNAAYADRHTLDGIIRFMRRNGASPGSLLLYRWALTLDAPLQWLVHAVRQLGRQLPGRQIATKRSRLLGDVGSHLGHGDLLGVWKA